MNKKTNKIFSLLLIAIIMTSFTGCLNLSGTTKEEPVADDVVVVNNNQGVFKSIDRGKTWEHKIDVIDGSLIDGVKILSMKMDPQDNNILYLGTTANGLYRSLNGADSWEKITDENGIFSPVATIYDIAIEKGNSDIIYVATLNNGRGELLKTEDGGKSWIESHIISELNKPIYAVEIDPKSQNVIYIGTAQAGFIKSENRGKEWETVMWFEAKEEVKDILIDFWNNNGIILRLSTGLKKTIDRGKEWEDLGTEMAKSVRGVRAGAINSITMHPANPLILYITYKNLVIISRDGGNSWEKLNTITPSKTVIGTVPQIKQIGLIGDIVYYGAGNVLYKSDNAGMTWSMHDIPIKGDVRYTISDYRNSDVIYVGSFYDPPPPPPPPKKKGFF
ncbi:MAG: hypothetical protein KAQ64_00260 [Candidatus Pacebacteria bacterium]|nr:hypothetical protein [Candidatus Paceibacterota bacterium]